MPIRAVASQIVSVAKVCPQCGEQYEASVGFCPRDGTALASASDVNLVGKVVGGRYRVIAQLGEGGMGQVYLAEHIRMKRKSAIKIMRPALVHEPEALQRFTREAENASKISHPNVAGIFDFGETDEGLVYLAMEYIDGESLSTLLKREVAMHPVVAADIIAQAADALQAAHDLGILHRDIKPDNVMVTQRSDGTFVVKLVDFGIARTMDRGTQQVTRTGFAVGTPEFMSPEQLSGDALDARSDQYSLALVAFNVLTGHDAFTSASSKESLLARLTSRPRRLDEVRGDLEWPLSLQEVFDKALAPDPGDRFPTVAEFGATLANSVAEMTPTQTAELYRHALGQRMSSVASRTPGDLVSVGTPSVGLPGPKSKPAAPAPARRKDPLALGPRRSIFPYVVLAGALTYAVWWYGSRQPAGAARTAADRIGSAASAVTVWMNELRGRPADTTVVAAPVVEVPVEKPATTPRRAKRKADSVARTAKDSAAASARPSAPPPTDSAAVKADTLATDAS
jgi:serine/threonine-protein kinase